MMKDSTINFFSDVTKRKQTEKLDLIQNSNYISVIEAISRLTHKSIYVIDNDIHKFEYVFDNHLNLYGLNTDEIKEKGYDAYLENVVAEDLELLLKIKKIVFDFFDKIDVRERRLYTISYDFRIKNGKDAYYLLNHKLTPLFINNKGEIGKFLCLVSLSPRQKSGNIIFRKKGENIFSQYDIECRQWRSSQIISITQCEQEVLTLSAQGYSIKQIARKLFVSENTIKFHRQNLFKKFQVNNITEVISRAADDQLI